MNNILAVVALVIVLSYIGFSIYNLIKRVSTFLASSKSANPAPQPKSWRDYKGVVIVGLTVLGFILLAIFNT